MSSNPSSTMHSASTPSDAGGAKRRRLIITTDIPDPDNFVAVLRLLQLVPAEEKVAIVLSPRPVDFEAIPLPNEAKNALFKFFGAINAGKDISAAFQIMQPLRTKEDVEALHKTLMTHKSFPEEHLCWFYHDRGFKDDDNVIKDTKLYMEVSAARLVNYLNAHNINPERYDLYTKSPDKTSTIEVGMSHKMHSPDFSFDFDESLRKSMEGETAEDSNAKQTETRDPSLRVRIQAACKAYLEAKGGSKPLNPLSELISACEVEKPSRMFIGGPFTEPLEIINKLAEKGDQNERIEVFAQGGATQGKSNLFPNQFNFHVDLQSARKFLEKASEDDSKFTLQLVPTECVKGSPFAMNEGLQAAREFKDWNDFLDKGLVVDQGTEKGIMDQATVDLYKKFIPTEEPGQIYIFDLVAALIMLEVDKEEIQGLRSALNPVEVDEWTSKMSNLLQSNNKVDASQKWKANAHKLDRTKAELMGQSYINLIRFKEGKAGKRGLMMYQPDWDTMEQSKKEKLKNLFRQTLRETTVVGESAADSSTKGEAGIQSKSSSEKPST